jgi:hypothetical protein
MSWKELLGTTTIFQKLINEGFMKSILEKFSGQFSRITDYRQVSEFGVCERAFLANGTVKLEKLNRSLLRKNQSGYWSIADDRIQPGDLLFLVLPDLEKKSKNSRELYAGIIREIASEEQRKLIKVREFFRLPNIADNIKIFLGNKTPPQGNRVLSIWDVTETKLSTESAFEKRVAAAHRDGAEARRKRLLTAPKKPARRTVNTTVFNRNPDVVAEVESRAAGKCEVCGKSAPFVRGPNGLRAGVPYLEVHHKIRLTDDGEDTVANAIAVCPNCHRKSHYG